MNSAQQITIFCIYITVACQETRESLTKKDTEKGGKDSQLVLRLAKKERDTFVALCKEMDTSAAREIRRFIRDFVRKNG